MLVSVFPYSAPKIAHRATEGRVFSLHNEFTPPPFRRRGWVSPVSGLLVFSRREARCFSAGKDGYYVSEGFSRQLPLATDALNCPHGFNRAGLVPGWCRFPYPGSKITRWAHRAEFWFLLTRWHFSERISCSFSELSCKNSGRRKKRLCPAFENLSRLSSPPRTSVFQKSSGENPFSLFMRRRFCAAVGSFPGVKLHGISS